MKSLALQLLLVINLILAGCQSTSDNQKISQQSSRETVWVLLTDPPIVLEQGKRFEGFQSNAADYAVKGGLAVAALPIGLGLQLGLGIIDLLIEAEQNARTEKDLKPLTEGLSRQTIDNLVLSHLKEIDSLKNADIRMVRSTQKFNHLYDKSRSKGKKQRFIAPTLSISKDYRSLQLNVSVRGRQGFDYTAFSKELNTIFVSESINYWRAGNLKPVRSFVSEHLTQAFLPLTTEIASIPFETLAFELQGEQVTTRGQVLSRNGDRLRFKDKQGRVFSVWL